MCKSNIVFLRQQKLPLLFNRLISQREYIFLLGTWADSWAACKSKQLQEINQPIFPLSLTSMQEAFRWSRWTTQYLYWSSLLAYLKHMKNTCPERERLLTVSFYLSKPVHCTGWGVTVQLPEREEDLNKIRLQFLKDQQKTRLIFELFCTMYTLQTCSQ